MQYRLLISPDAEKDVQEAFDYLAYSIEGVGNPLVAKKFYLDLEDAFEKIELFPEGFSICEDAELAAVNLRKIKLSHYNYDVFYHIIDDLIIIDMVCHNLRDFREIVKERL